MLPLHRDIVWHYDHQTELFPSAVLFRYWYAKAGHTGRRRSGRCDERIGLWWDERAEGSQSVSQSVWTFGTETADSISMPICLVSLWIGLDLHRLMTPEAWDQVDAFRLKPDTHTRWYVTEMGKTFSPTPVHSPPVFAQAHVCLAACVSAHET